MREERPFRLARPDRAAAAAVFSSPHSGRAYPASLLERSRLDRRSLRASEDAFVEELFAAAPDLGAPLLSAVVPRAFVDLNRGPEELDPAVVMGVRATGLNPRVAAGLGVVPRIVAEGRAIYDGKITLEEAEERLRVWHRPYHEMLEALLTEAVAAHGYAVLFDCHSMPSDALRSAPRVRGGRADIVLGDRFGATAGRDLMDRTVAAFEAAGFAVACNAPFAGGHITQRHGRPARGVHAIQVEIDRGLYLDQRRVEKHDGFDSLRTRLEAVLPHLPGMDAAGLLAAE